MARAASRITFPLMEWPTSTTFGRDSASTTARTSWPKAATVQSLRSRPERPWPARSIVTTLVLAREAGTCCVPVAAVDGPAVDEDERELALALVA